jgi:hypothetical protein
VKSLLSCFSTQTFIVKEDKGYENELSPVLNHDKKTFNLEASLLCFVKFRIGSKKKPGKKKLIAF